MAKGTLRRKEGMVQRDATIRPMKRDDIRAIVGIDTSITKTDRTGYYVRKMRVLDDPDAVNICLVAELDGKVVGFVMGDLYHGEYGIPDTTAVIDTIGIQPDYQDRGLGTALFSQFRSNLKALNVRTTYVLIEWGDWQMSKFFEKEGFVPSDRVNLELKL